MRAIASTCYGRLEGDEQDGLIVFKGVPFATAPVVPLRWLAPEKPALWTGVRDARSFGVRLLLSTRSPTRPLLR